ncbi:hypothetical protein DOE73_19850 [Paenibacillus dendritiformis]|nr:hypothetical protein DOE73_19850 [Paenibacillus dendritiformis]
MQSLYNVLPFGQERYYVELLYTILPFGQERVYAQPLTNALPFGQGAENISMRSYLASFSPWLSIFILVLPSGTRAD